MEKIFPSVRKKPIPGDVFTFKNKFLGYGYGMVIKIGGPMCSEDLLVYIYNVFTKEIDLNVKLNKNDLAIDPKFINRRGWLDGFFKTTKHTKLKKDDMLEQHCFVYRSIFENEPEYVDENREAIKERIEPCGFYGLGNHRNIDALMSERYNLPFALPLESDGEMPKKIKWW